MFEATKQRFEAVRRMFEAARCMFDATKHMFEAVRCMFDATKHMFEVTKLRFDVVKPGFDAAISMEKRQNSEAMNIALLGYGKMGNEIEKIAVERGHHISFIADVDNADYKSSELEGTDVAIEFSTPESAVDNIMKCFISETTVVVGTTGWYNRFDDIRKLCEDNGQTLFHATNFSIGVNIFSAINRKLAQLMETQPEYDVSMEETHHVDKLDAPSGTAITLGREIVAELSRKERWIAGEAKDDKQLPITSHREGEVPGTHTVQYESKIDTITITHQARNRTGFALGAVLAAEWVSGKKGVFTMKDMLQLF